ncbi:hypothetical protein [Hyphomonas sp.]|uniref:hypothetical protein n=1 Tax=Hyphomonas sp. TaxID=87 RepID=UPI0025BB441D|nr:hypothetical protein [Hyphomonas sp.]MBI1399607.1 hypothetical protein [Hyphomonas sp.]
MWPFVTSCRQVSSGTRASQLVSAVLVVLIALNAKFAKLLIVLIVSAIGMQATGFPLAFTVSLFVKSMQGEF